jgi:hypothetical protein
MEWLLLIAQILAMEQPLPNWLINGLLVLITALITSTTTYVLGKRNQDVSAEGVFRKDLLTEITALRTLISTAGTNEKTLQNEVLVLARQKVEAEIAFRKAEAKKEEYYDCLLKLCDVIEFHEAGEYEKAFRALDNIDCLQDIQSTKKQ